MRAHPMRWRPEATELFGRFGAGEVAVTVALKAGAVVRLRLLAVPALALADGALAPLERKDAALLALLALDGPLPRSRAAALLWPEVEPSKARNSLRQRLFRLRKVAGIAVVTDDAALALAPGIESDLAGLSARLADDPAEAAGDLLGSFGYDDCDELAEWVGAARERFRHLRRDALAAAAAREEAAGHVARALQFADRLVADDPLSEQAHQLVMRLHYRRGDRAAALAAHARCRQVLTTELHAEPGAETRELARLIERAEALPGGAVRPVLVAIAHPPRMIGREDEWQRLQAAWDSGRAALLTGDAGMGKTRLLSEFARAHGAVLVGARPGDDRVPYALLARLLRAALRADDGGAPLSLEPGVRAELAHVLPEAGDPPATPLVEARFREAVAGVLAQRQAAGLAGIALDDLHFADAASLQLLPVLAGGGLRWALAARGAEVDASLAGWQREEAGAALVVIALAPLTEAQVRQLLASLALEDIDPVHLAPALLRHAGGNPFFILETLGAIVARPHDGAPQLPAAPNVEALVERRLAQLTAGALRLARVAALAGVDFDAALAADVLQLHPLDLAEAWNELERAHVLAGPGFAHDLVRDAVARSVPAPIAELLHGRLADYLETQSAAPARIAQHCEEARQWARAARFHTAAAGAACRASRRAEEVARREAAAACLDRSGDHDGAFAARRAAVEPVILVRGVEQAQRMIDAMLAVARTDAQRAAALTARAMSALMAGDHVTGVASAREALSLAERQPDLWPRFEASRLLAVGLALQGSADEAQQVLAPFEAQVEAHGSAEQRGHYWADLAYVLNSARRLRRTADALERASACARELGDLAEMATLTTNLATVHGNLGHVERAHEYALRARSLQVELGDADGPSAGVIELHAGLYAAGLGRYDDALVSYERALAVFRRGDQTLWIAVSSNNQATTLLELGQFARARRALDYAAPPVQHVAARGALLAARLARLLGQAPGPELERAGEALARSADYYIGALLDLERAETLEPDAAVALCDRVRVSADGREFGGIALKARLFAARAALHAGDTASARARWSEIEPLRATLHPTDCYPPLAQAIGRDILLAVGDSAAAAACLRDALAWIRGTALPRVPEAFRDSFLHRNPVNRALLTAATRAR